MQLQDVKKKLLSPGFEKYSVDILLILVILGILTSKILR
jgi:hypothetical protein